MIAEVAAIAFGAGLAVTCVLIGVAIAGGRCRCGDDDDGGDDGDEDEIEPLFDDIERLVVIAVPRRDAPGAPGPSGADKTN